MAVDREKRRRIMQRSIKLGHCICNPRQACPCERFKQEDICQCAGERAAESREEVRLTELAENPGCASKISQNDLKIVLAGLPAVEDPRLLVGSSTGDDAGVYDLGEGLALVQTVDVFTPNVDDPYRFGRIAAANSLSDVYAMGGRPLTALSVITFPLEKLSHGVMADILRGGLEAMREAGVAVVGGHSLKDEEVKFGFAVTGLVAPERMVTNAGARPGDVLVLTKPLGVGIISFAAQIGRASAEAQDQAAQSMMELNREAAEVMGEVGVHAATDVTGFGLLGHLSEMVAQSGVTAEVWADRVPVFPAARELVEAGVISGAVERNREYARQYVTAEEGVSEALEWALYDPQTSGGLLMAAPAGAGEELVARLRERGAPGATVIGRVRERSEGRILLVNRGETEATVREEAASNQTERSCCGEETEEPAAEGGCCAAAEQPCCAGGEGGQAEEIGERFGAFLGAVNAPGALGEREKELLAVALSVLAKCEPCLKLHLSKARRVGLSEAEISEAVWMAVSFGGAPALMFYRALQE